MGMVQVTGGSLKSRKVSFSEAKGLRPTLSKTREAIFNVLANYIDFEKASFLDLFAGSGIMSFEAYSRGFGKVDCVESNPAVYKEIKSNINKLSVEVTPYLFRAEKFLEGLQQQYSVIFIDPPYADGLYDEILSKLAQNNVLSENGIIVVEKPLDLDVSKDKLAIIKSKIYSDKEILFLEWCKSSC